MNQTSPLETLAGPGKPLRQEPPDQNEINGLVAHHDCEAHYRHRYRCCYRKKITTPVLKA